MRIVVLDIFVMNPGDFPLDELHSLGECKIYDRTPSHLVLERLKGAEGIITNKVPISEEVMNHLPELKYIGITATGYNHVDIKAAKKRGIVVTNIPAYSTPSTAQQTFALLLEATNQVGCHNEAVQAGEWGRSPDFTFRKKPLIELNQLTLGIIGFGQIGRAVSKIAIAFGMKVIVSTRTAIKSDEISFVDQDALFRNSDVISLHCPLNEHTYHLINQKTLAMMKRDAILINVSRGSLIDENALAQALKQNEIYMAALDVLEQEPPSNGSPLIGLSNCIITPHIAWATLKARRRLYSITIQNLKNYLLGTPQNVVLNM